MCLMGNICLYRYIYILKTPLLRVEATLQSQVGTVYKILFYYYYLYIIGSCCTFKCEIKEFYTELDTYM